MDFVLHDLRQAARNLRRSPGFAAVTILTLGLGIGLVTALFAVVDAVLLRPIVAHQDRVVRIWQRDDQRGMPRVSISYRMFRAWREHSRGFDGLAAIQYADASTIPLLVDDQPRAVALAPVSANFLALLHDGPPREGRWLQAADEAPGAELTGVVSEAFARSVPGIVGRRLTWAGGGRTVLIVGVAPAEIDYPRATDIWVPAPRFFDGVAGRFDVENPRLSHFELVARLAPGVSRDQARAELTLLQEQLVAQFPDDYRALPLVVEPLLDTLLGNSRQVVLFLFAAAGLVFVIAGVNVAALLLMRASAQRREMAVRVALGASRTRLARQTIAESLLLGTLGVAAGLAAAQLFLAAARVLAPGDVPRIEQAALNVWVCLFCIATAFAWVVALGTAPVWAHRRLALTPAAERTELSLRGGRGARGLRLFTVAEVAAAVVIAIGAGLLVRSMAQLQGIDRGFTADHLAVLKVLLPDARYPDAPARVAFYDRLLPDLESLPGVTSATTVHVAPGSGVVGLSAQMVFDGQTPDDARTNPWATWEPVTPSFFRTLGIPIVQGRGFTEADGRTGAPVAVISEAVAERYWPGQNPVGRRLKFIPSFDWVTVVGVAADLRYRELTRTWLTVYFPAAQFFFFAPGSLVVRTGPPPAAVLAAIRERVRAHEPQAAVASIDTMDGLLAKELVRPRTALAVASLFALLAIVLAAVGVYGVMSYEVRQRRQELAVRAALGASRTQILAGVVVRSLALGASGAAIGLAVSAAATRGLQALLFETSPLDPAAFLAAAATLLTIVVLASWLPARRAASADPAAALRAE